MSDTPETDKIAHAGLPERAYISEMTHKARKLERERDEARNLFQTSKSARRSLNDALDKTLKENRELREEMESEKRWAAQYKQERDKWADAAARYSFEREHNACYAKQMEAERDELRAELERLKADKARMDWLENLDCDSSFWGALCDTTNPRKAIDAAMKGAE